MIFAFLNPMPWISFLAICVVTAGLGDKPAVQARLRMEGQALSQSPTMGQTSPVKLLDRGTKPAVAARSTPQVRMAEIATEAPTASFFQTTDRGTKPCVAARTRVHQESASTASYR